MKHCDEMGDLTEQVPASSCSTLSFHFIGIQIHHLICEASEPAAFSFRLHPDYTYARIFLPSLLRGDKSAAIADINRYERGRSD